MTIRPARGRCIDLAVGLPREPPNLGRDRRTYCTDDERWPPASRAQRAVAAWAADAGPL